MSATRNDRSIVGDATHANDYAAAVARRVENLGDEQSALMPLLHALQEEFGYIDDLMVPAIASALNISRADVHGVVTFYHDFRRQPAGRHRVQLCRAEACQARGAAAIERLASERLDLRMGETSADGRVTLDAVYCLGLCATGPNAMIDDVPVSRLDPTTLDRLLGDLR
ncbi:formate dehydrogenase subunit gamma [Sphingomonas asaccharolytica]|uniref:formate dehydrogenase subunit gamma n=1 Tax=Sphingomonas asaccharolytica TaxID=40681 RepID=UPI000AFA1442|nr:formate dehydrogenase subunit gamma [Sphingomonas asaccharolytica]